MARISSVNLCWKDNTAVYDDSDAQTDYFNAYTAGIQRIAEEVKERGGKSISVTVTNNDPKIPALKRVQLIAKVAGYLVEDKSHLHTYRGYMGAEDKRFVFEWLLTAGLERLKAIEEEDAEWLRKRLEREEYERSPEGVKRRVESELRQIQASTAVIDGRGFHVLTAEDKVEMTAKVLEKVKDWKPIVEAEDVRGFFAKMNRGED